MIKDKMKKSTQEEKEREERYLKAKNRLDREKNRISRNEKYCSEN